MAAVKTHTLKMVSFDKKPLMGSPDANLNCKEEIAAFLGCSNLFSDVPKVEIFICSPSDPLIWFTRFPK